MFISLLQSTNFIFFILQVCVGRITQNHFALVENLESVLLASEQLGQITGFNLSTV